MPKRNLDPIIQPGPRPKRPRRPRVQAPPPEPLPELEPEVMPEELAQDTPTAWQRTPLAVRLLGGLFVLAALYAGSFELVYAGKILPGVTADGLYLGGLSRDAAAKRLAEKTTTFTGHVVTVSHGDTNLRIPVSTLAAKYDPARAADQAYTYGRQGDFWVRLDEHVRSVFGRDTTVSTLAYNPARLTPYITELADDLITPVQNASLSFNDNQPQVTPAQSGTRLDLGRLIQLVHDRLAATSSEPIPAPVYQLAPDLDTAPLQAATGQISQYLAGPITLARPGAEHVVDQAAIISWIQIGHPPAKQFLHTLKLDDLYPPPPSVHLSLSQTAIKAYVAELAGRIDQTAQNAGLAMQDNQLTVIEPSRAGLKLDQPAAVTAILTALDKPATDRRLDLKLDTTIADVHEANLESLGIKELISTGETYFPGSPSTRLINVRTGAKRFNGVLLKPGEQFSFGKLLGEVGPHTGYVPELVILQNKVEKQYGGGLCQVSSTAFRAALAAGLPITQRINHSYAISYYTWPYSAPGVDATIYYPAVDFKFVNDTGHYLLMQTVMEGYNLKFYFFGTKTKSGTIRGPQFITGSNDNTKPSRTVFYRDVLDLSGKVIKTDTFYTNYKSSKDFPITQQFN